MNHTNNTNNTHNYKNLYNVKNDFKENIMGNVYSRNFNISLIELLFSNQPPFLRKVLILHFIIMYYEINHVQYYLEYLKQHHSLACVNLVVNYPIEFNLKNTIQNYNRTNITFIENHKYPYNQFNSLHVAALWSNDIDVIRLLYSYSAAVWSHDLFGFYADELLLHSKYYYDHLLEYYASREVIINLPVYKRFCLDFNYVNREINLLAGESIPEDYIGLTNWSYPNIYS